MDIENIVSKARKLTGILYWQFYQWSNPEALSKLYTTLIRPHLEYAAPVWSPTLAKDIGLLENVQNLPSEYVATKDWNSPYEVLLAKCGLSKLSSYLILCHRYKIVNGLCTFPNAPVAPYSNN